MNRRAPNGMERRVRHRWIVVLLAACALVVVLAASAASAATEAFPPGTYGYDRSWPECGLSAPPPPYDFGIIGVNGGKTFNYNSCLREEYAWAMASGHQPALYVNLKSPIGTSADQGLTGPKGTCQPSDGACIAYNFGYKAAQDAAIYAATQQAFGSSWWLDVETENTWSTDTAMNALVIGGALDFLRTSGVTVGIYSSQVQWVQIAGDYAPGVPVWVTTAPDAASAPGFCPRSFGGGQTALVQFIAGNRDHDYACTAADRAKVVASAPLGAPGSPAVVTTDGGCLNVRDTPGFVGRRVTCLAQGSQVTVLAGAQTQDGYEWRQISAGGATGWVAGTYLRAGTASAGDTGTVGTGTGGTDTTGAGAGGGTTGAGSTSGTLTPPPVASGVNAAEWGGGTLADLVARAPRAVSIWVFEGGKAYGDIPGAPAYVNASFVALFPGGVLPAGTIVLVVLP